MLSSSSSAPWSSSAARPRWGCITHTNTRTTLRTPRGVSSAVRLRWGCSGMQTRRGSSYGQDNQLTAWSCRRA
jgi:hypothetical protein